MNKLFTQLVEKRHLDDTFLHPKYEKLIPASEMPDMDKAVARLKKASENKHLMHFSTVSTNSTTNTTKYINIKRKISAGGNKNETDM